jgi:hypothetical protein
MTGARKVGILIVILGAFPPSVLYPSASPTTDASILRIAFATEGVLYPTTLKDLEVVLVEGKLAILFRYTLGAGVSIFFTGIAVVALSRKKEQAKSHAGS